MKKAWKITGAIIGIILVVVLLRGCVMTSYLIPSSGMENSLFQGERILVNKWSYGLRLPLMALWNYHRWGDSPVEKEDIIVFNNPANLSESVISRREVFISRCIGVPGDTLLIDSLFSVIPSEKNAPDQKFLYAYPRKKEKQLDSLLTLLSICDNCLMGQDSIKNVRSFSRYEYYLLEQAMNGNCWIKLLDKKAEIKNDTLYIEGKPVQHCYFTKDYYWVSANNSINLSDSRLFGFVPKDHIIGKASLIWFSKESDTGLFGGYRWKRFFSPVQ